jgi:hypothetical protein
VGSCFIDSNKAERAARKSGFDDLSPCQNQIGCEWCKRCAPFGRRRAPVRHLRRLVVLVVLVVHDRIVFVEEKEGKRQEDDEHGEPNVIVSLSTEHD